MRRARVGSVRKRQQTGGGGGGGGGGALCVSVEWSAVEFSGVLVVIL